MTEPDLFAAGSEQNLGQKLPTLTFEVPGPPLAKGRPRFRHVKTKAGQEFTTTYTDRDTVQHENLIRFAAVSARDAAGYQPFVGAIAVSIVLRIPVPQSWSQKRKSAAITGRIGATKRPDFDNCLKAVLDACNGVLWHDDSQVVECHVHKRYSPAPATVVRVIELGVAPA